MLKGTPSLDVHDPKGRPLEDRVAKVTPGFPLFRQWRVQGLIGPGPADTRQKNKAIKDREVPAVYVSHLQTLETFNYSAGFGLCLKDHIATTGGLDAY